MSRFPELQFSHPDYLLGLVIIPFVLYAGYRGLTDFPRWQRRLSAAVRMGVVVLVVLGLAGLTWLRDADHPFVVYVVDRSLSVGEKGRQAADDFVTTSLRGAEGAGVGFVEFGKAPGPFQTHLGGPSEEVDRGATDLAAALRAARLGVPPGYTPHLVLVSDGNETDGDVRAAATGLGCRVSTVPLPPRSEPEVQLTAVVLPDRVRPGETFTVEVVIDTNHATRCRLKVLGGVRQNDSDDDSGRVVDLRSGENRIPFTQTLPGNFAGRRLVYQGTIDELGPTEDTIRENNIAVGLTEVIGKPALLLVEPAENGPVYRAIGRVLAESGFSVVPTTTARLPHDAGDLQKYDLLVLGDVPVVSEKPEHALTAQQMDALKAYARDGGGVLVIGGGQTFGPGGYYKSRLEDILPVTCDYEKKKDKPVLALVLVIDKSGCSCPICEVGVPKAHRLG